ncbi:MAG: sulfatase [Holophagales bacterium]|nr:sulfatase [Holophagales bacterium]MYG29765.1 sulfatase [Holophagales bacterium]MYI79179.1 sulfatase [Holophagales bacterium]
MRPARYPTPRAVLAAAVCVACLAACAVETPAEPPNVVFLLVDDLGAMDIGAFNPDTFYETPNIDRLAAGGMCFTRSYAANPVCSPTRYSIMTGRYPTRVGATNYFAGRREEKFAPAPLNDRMPLEEYTLAEALRDGGYSTAFLGKWHLGPTQEFWPLAQGFDVNVGGHRGGMPRSYFSPYSNPTLEDGPEDEHLTARLTSEALALLDGYAAEEEGKPFLIYLSYYTVHTPLRAPADLIEKYAAKAGVEVGAPASPDYFGEEEQIWPRNEPRRVREVQNHAVYAAMVETLDTSVGRILDRLDALDLAENTIVVFFSDNGGLSTAEGSPTSNLPLRGGKGWLYEGGIREPMIVRWPAVAAAGGVTSAPVISTDFYPTLLEAAGVDVRTGIEIDGSSFLDILRGGDAGAAADAAASERDLFWHYPHYANQGGFPGGAIARGRYKLIERYEDGQVHLYDLAADVGERNDLAAEQPERLAEMRARLHAWYGDVGAEFLSALPDGPEPWRPPVRDGDGG